MAFIPTEEEAQGFVTIEATANLVGFNVLIIPAIEKQTGPFANMPRNLAMLSPAVIKEAVRVAKITESDGQERLLATVEAAQIGLVWRITRRELSGNLASWVDIDPFEVPSDQGATQSVRVVEAPSFGAKKLKMAHILDQGDESESALADAGHITVWIHNFFAITHGQPDEEETPTNEQLSALNVRVIIQLGSSYADFAVFTPHARKTTRAHRFTAHLPQPGRLLAGERNPWSNKCSSLALLLERFPCGVFNVEGSARDASGQLPAENRESGNSVANSLASCLFGRRQVPIRALQSF